MKRHILAPGLTVTVATALALLGTACDAGLLQANSTITPAEPPAQEEPDGKNDGGGGQEYAEISATVDDLRFGVVTGTALLLTLQPTSPENTIYYTTNGTPATTLLAQNPDSPDLFAYDGTGIQLMESTDPADYALTPRVTYDPAVVGTYDFGYVSKGVPLSLAEVAPDGTPVTQKRGTFIFSADGPGHFGTLPVVCLTAPADDWIGADGTYNNLAEEVKIRAWLEYYDYSTDDAESFALNTQIKRGGAWTMNLPKRTLNANFKKQEDGKTKNDPPTADIFGGRLAVGTDKEIQGTVRRFRLHSGGNDTFLSFFNDAFIQRVAYNGAAHVATAAYRPCALYLNGEYWGLYALREHYNEDYVEYNFGVDSDDVVYVDKNWKWGFTPENSRYGYEVKTEDKELGLSLLDDLYAILGYTAEPGTYGTSGTVDERDWASEDSAAYAELCKAVDIDSLIDLILIEGYIGNYDFVSNNLRMWRTVPNPQKGKTKKSSFGDGKWRFMLHDTDGGCWDAVTTNLLSVDDQAAGKNIFDFFLGNAKIRDTTNGDWGQAPVHHLLISAPAQNPQFKQQLWERAKEIQAMFAPGTAIPVLDAMQDQIAPLYDDYATRWGAAGYSAEAWKTYVQNRRPFLEQRPEHFEQEVRSAFIIPDDWTWQE